MRASLSSIQHEQVAKLAYELWERSGRPMDTAMRDWLLAERIVRRFDSSNPSFGAFSLEPDEQ